LKRRILIGCCLLIALIVPLACQRHEPPVKVGILHSRTGTMAISEKPVIDATLFAIEQINRNGGVLGRRIEAVVVDGASDPPRFASQARRLIRAEKVAVIFGCWTSASRKEVKEVVEKEHSLLIYPIQYEGVESSPNIIYTGSVPNQQIKPAVKWALDHLGRSFYLVGSDYIFPRVANALIKDLAGFLGATVTGESYLPLGATDFDQTVQEIAASRPSVVFNTLNGDSNLAFFAALQRHGLTADRLPVISFSIAETEVQAMRAKLGNEALIGHYAASSYFETLPGEENAALVSRFASRYGKDSRLTDPMVAAYAGVLLWAQAATDAGTLDPTAIRHAFARQSMKGPGGIIYIDDRNGHAWKTARIGRINAEGRFDLLWQSAKPIRPEPFPSYAARSRWQTMERDFYAQWGNRWENSVESKQ